MMVNADTREKETPEIPALPPVCPLCWDWVWPGEQTVMLDREPAHRRCYYTSEGY